MWSKTLAVVCVCASFSVNMEDGVLWKFMTKVNNRSFVSRSRNRLDGRGDPERIKFNLFDLICEKGAMFYPFINKTCFLMIEKHRKNGGGAAWMNLL